jgi:exodeoxyribonuclease V alpha subunit
VQTLKGTVLRVVYRQDEFAILSLQVGRESYTVVGDLAQYQPGQKLVGQFVAEEHPRYGLQYRYQPPGLEEAAQRFLETHFSGLGPKTAQRLIHTLGTDLNFLAHPEAMRDLAGIPLTRAQTWSQEFGEVAELWAHEQVLYALDLTPRQRSLAQRRWREDASRVLLENPYRLMELEGVGFAIADSKARKLGLATADPRRLQAAAVHAVERWLDWGHTAVSHDRIVRVAPNLGLDEAMLESGLWQARDEGMLYLDEAVWGLARVRQAELGLLGLAETSTTSYWPQGETAELVALFELLSRHRTVALTGAAGTGKTTLVARLLEEMEGEVLLATPTGKAARRLEEVLSQQGLPHPASTLHRLLGEHDELPDCDLVVVDEASMVDALLLARLQRALGQTPLLLVGDTHQLPPVGPGQPFRDLLPLLGHLELTTIHRQAAQSPIVQAAHRVLRGQRPLFDSDPRLQFIELDEPAQIVQAVATQPTRPVLLTPTRKGDWGTEGLNPLLQRALGPQHGPRVVLDGGGARVGDPVICTRNNYELEVMNGEVGTVSAIGSGYMKVSMAERELEVPELYFPGFQLAYAITVHKFQGSQAPWVFLVLHPSQRPVLSRELLYTGLTRASEGLVLLGQPQALELALRTQAARRSTWLGWAQRQGWP